MNDSDVLGNFGVQFGLRWDGWEGFLDLYPSAIGGSVLHTGGNTFPVRYELLHAAEDNVEGLQGPGYLGANTGPGYRIVFWVRFSDEQRFDGYLFTQTHYDAMAGVTWWNNLPFGFYGVRRLFIPG